MAGQEVAIPKIEFHYPFSLEISTVGDVDENTMKMMEWMTIHGMLGNSEAAAQFKLHDMSGLIMMAFPWCTGARRQMAVDLISWGVFWDDYSDRGVGKDPRKMASAMQ